MKTAELEVCCICVLFYLKWFSILCKFLSKAMVLFVFHGHLELFESLSFMVEVPG